MRWTLKLELTTDDRADSIVRVNSPGVFKRAGLLEKARN